MPRLSVPCPNVRSALEKEKGKIASGKRMKKKNVTKKEKETCQYIRRSGRGKPSVGPEMQPSIRDAVLPEEASLLYNSYGLHEFKCMAIQSTYFKKECLPKVFTVLQKDWPISNFDHGEYVLQKVMSAIDMEKVNNLPDECEMRYGGAEDAEICLHDLMVFLDIKEKEKRDSQ